MATATAPNVTNLPVDQIDPSPDNPRTAFGGDLGNLTELTELIKAQGVLQRLVVCPEADGRYPLVFGERRLAAAKLAGLAEVPVEIRDYDDAERFTAMYGENLGRVGLTPLQEAFAYQRALERKGPDGKKLFTQRTLARQLGVGQAKVSNYTGIFKLPEHVVALLKGGELTITEAIHLVRLAKDPARVEAALREVAEHRDVDMETAVRMQQADLDREAKVAQALKELQTTGVRIAPDDWRERGGKKLGDGVYDLDMAVEEHAAEPCHAAMVTHHGDVAHVCTEPDRHRPTPEPAPEPTPTSDLADAATTPVQPAAEAATDSDSQPSEAPADPAVAAPSVGPATPQDTPDAPQALAVEPPTPTPEEVAAKLGLSPQRPLYRAWQQHSEAVVRWKVEDYPQIRAEAQQVGATIWCADEAGVRSDYHAGTTWAPVGQTPVVLATGDRFAINLISAVTAKGALRFAAYDGNLNGPVFIDFCRRLLHDAPGPVFLVLDGHPVHRSNAVKAFAASTNGRLRLFFLLGYAPELNPVEMGLPRCEFRRACRA